MSKFTVYLLALIKLTVLVCIGILCVIMLYGLLRLTTSPLPIEIALHTMETIGLDGLADIARDFFFTSKSSDHMDVFSYHQATRSWVIDCIGFDDFDDLPLKIRRSFMLPGEIDVEPVSLSGADAMGNLAEGKRMPTPGERALIQLSSTLAVHTMALHSKAQSAYFFWQCTSLIAIVLGMITTILVSVSSTEFGRGDGRNQRLIRLLAIIFPALGTAAAGVIAFYSPQAEWSQASRTLASVNQLHGQIALGVWKLACPKADNQEDAKLFATTLEDWVKRYQDIQIIASTTSGATGPRGESTSGGGKPGSGSSGQGGGARTKAPSLAF